MLYVVGSGPAAMAATQALVAQGRPVTILDAGQRLEPGQAEVLHRMRNQVPEQWRAEDRAALMGQRTALQERIHSKLSYGSSYASDSHNNAVGLRWQRGQGFNYSLAAGGLSNIWGSALLPYRQADIPDWPIRIDDLDPHYRAVMKFVPGTFVADDLETLLPSHSSLPHVLQPSRQGAQFLADLKTHREPLRQAGVFFGRSRVAVRGSGDATHPPCVYCALCLSGCPYELIYSSAQTLDDLRKNPLVTYMTDRLVERFEDLPSGVRLHARNLKTNALETYDASRVLIGGGVLSTAAIVLRSLAAIDTPVTLLDSQYFILPLLRFRHVDNVVGEAMHTLSQVFLEIDDPAVSPHFVHLQIYGYSEFLNQELHRTFLRWPLRSAAFRNQFLGRLLLAQGFLHSRDSARLKLTLLRGADGATRLDIQHLPSLRTFCKVLRVGGKLLRHARELGAVPLLPGLQFPRPGSGYHSGGTFPMKERPGPLETDILGRIGRSDRVHLIDASVFPSIPGTSITFSVMANAHRIATEVARLN